jgi:hypothetical protein
MTVEDLLHRLRTEFDEAGENLAWGLKLTGASGNVRKDARDNALRHEERPEGVASQAGYRLQGKTTSNSRFSSPWRSGTQTPVEGAIIQSLGSIKVAIKDGYVVSAVDTEGSKWRAGDLQKISRPSLRRLTHGFVLMAALVPISVTLASAHQPAQPAQRIVLNSNPVDSHELSTAIPPAPPPAPSPSPSPSPTAKPAAKPAAVSRPVTIAPSQEAVAAIIRAAAAKWGADPNQLIRVAMCESHLNPNSYNPAGYYGLFQFNPNTFKAHGGTNIWDATDQANVAAHMFAQGLSGEWGCK